MAKKQKRTKVELKENKSPENKYKISDVFTTSHFIMGFFAAVGVVSASFFLSELFLFKPLSFVLSYLVIQLGLALDYYYERNIDERFLVSFYIFSNIFFIVNFLSFFNF